MRRFAIVVTALAALVLAAAPASGAIRLRTVQYDPAGADTLDNVNEEYVVVKNTGTSARAIGEWTLRSGESTYTFPEFVLRPGRIVFVHTGSGEATRRHLYWGRGRHAWVNTTGGLGLWSGPLPIRPVDDCFWLGPVLTGRVDC